MGRNAKPIDLIVMDGKTHLTKAEIRERREREIKPDKSRVQCPDWLCETGKAEWDRIQDDLIDLNLLTNLDVNQLAIYCDAYAKYIEAAKQINEKGLTMEYTNKLGATNLVNNPYVQIATKYAEIVKKYCDEFGLSPVSRAKMSIPTKSGTNKDNRMSGLI